IPHPRYKLLIDLQFEEASVLAPELDKLQRVMAPGGQSIKQFEFKPETLDVALTEALPDAQIAEFLRPELAGPPAPSAEGTALLERAREAVAHGKLDDATELTLRALRAGADRREFLLLQGDIYMRRGLAGEAVERFTAVLSDVSTHGDPASDAAQEIVRRALAGAARSFLELGKILEAVEAAERLSAISANDGGALRLLGRALIRVNDYNRAVTVLEQARVTLGSDASLLGELGSAYYGAGRTERAEETLRQAIKLDDFAINARIMLGRILAATNRADQAAAEYRTALEYLPSHGEAAFALAELERNAGRTKNAIAVIADLLSVDPYHVEALVKLGRLLAESGRPDQAQLAFRRVLRFDPGHEGAVRGLEAMDHPSAQAS
ncbi:MAG TPA: tetratricopeptide repeat protein, partial [Longimicrobiales bacterium]